jgi:hypothetical protein
MGSNSIKSLTGPNTWVNIDVLKYWLNKIIKKYFEKIKNQFNLVVVFDSSSIDLKKDFFKFI